MIKSSKLIGFLYLSGIFFISGCSIFPEAQPDIPVSYFDIGFPAKIKGSDKIKQIEVQDARTTEPYNERMVFRASDTHLQIDEYNRWASAPSDMLKRYFIMAFNQDEVNQLQKQSNKKFKLYITVMRIEANLKSNEVTLSFYVEIRNAIDGDIAYTEYMTDSCKIDKMNAECFASGVKILTDKMIENLSKNSFAQNIK